MSWLIWTVPNKNQFKYLWIEANETLICQTFQIFCATPLSGSTSDLESQERLVRPSSSSPSAASATAGCLRVGNGGGGGQAGSRRRSGSRTSSGSSDNEEDCETRWEPQKPQKCFILLAWYQIGPQNLCEILIFCELYWWCVNIFILQN